MRAGLTNAGLEQSFFDSKNEFFQLKRAVVCFYFLERKKNPVNWTLTPESLFKGNITNLTKNITIK